MTLGFGLLLFSLTIPMVRAIDVNVSACVPEGENTTAKCNDGIDNDCDSKIDYADEDCVGGCIHTCGNSVVECNEQCESDANCNEGYFCNDSCQCQVGGGPPPPPPPPPPCEAKPVTCGAWSGCVGGIRTRVCTDSCTSWDQTQECLVGCGDGTIGSGEECDDGNINPGDCCSAICTLELLINGVLESVTNTTARINWSTPCQSTGSLLEWGETLSLSDGSASLAGKNFSYTITGLGPNTTYYYQITATAGALQASYSGSFLTLGGVENCNNSIDDDSDGFCDYPASSCTDGSVPGDPECSCQPDFVCIPGECQENNRWTVTCIDQTLPKCQPDYEYEEECGVCPGVFCGPCQELDEENCICVDLENCCGNGICEPLTEDPYSCPGDCPVECLSDWECSPWQPEPCPPSAIQSRNCFDKNACEVPINPPATQQSCGVECPGLACGLCQQINIEQCICEEQVPCCGNGTCELGESHEQCPQDCILLCKPNWTCLNWGPCQNGVQTRECYDLNSCELNLDRPPEIRSCTPGCDVACNLCQNINLEACSCLAFTPCCGNSICEAQETVWSCPVDCGLPPNFRFGLPQCLDGLDNDNDGFVDYPADSGCSKPSDNSELNFFEILQQTADFLRNKFFDNPLVEQANKRFAAPAIVTIATINTFAGFSLLNLLSYLRYLFTQPAAVLFRRRRKKWGVVYNSLTKQPVDLAIVRLYKQENGQLVQSRVTDKVGRYNFIASPGRYYLTATKPGFIFPTLYLKDKKEDVKYLDVYHGETIEVTEQRAVLTANIPLDPKEDIRTPAKIVFQYYLRRAQYAFAFSAIPLATLSLVISPNPFTISLFGFHCLLYALFRRLSYQKPPKSWGIIYDKTDKNPVGLAITRIYDKQYNKLLETRVTDGKGRYSFLVDNNIYYLTVEKLGYKKVKTEDIDLLTKKREEIVNVDIALEKGQGEMPPAIVPAPPTPPTMPSEKKVGMPAKLQPPLSEVAKKPVLPPPPAEQKPVEKPILSGEELEGRVEEVGVSRESLTELMRAKESVAEIKEDIEEEKEKLEQLEDKVEDLEENIEQKIEEKTEVVKPEKIVKASPVEPSKPLSDKPDQSKKFKDNIFG